MNKKGRTKQNENKKNQSVINLQTKQNKEKKRKGTQNSLTSFHQTHVCGFKYVFPFDARISLYLEGTDQAYGCTLKSCNSRSKSIISEYLIGRALDNFTVNGESTSRQNRYLHRSTTNFVIFKFGFWISDFVNTMKKKGNNHSESRFFKKGGRGRICIPLSTTDPLSSINAPRSCGNSQSTISVVK